ncbi:MAG: DsrE family protein [Saprospiraceae bacterium]|nr:DsrE family protein [Saprospiraceae bacterium]
MKNINHYLLGASILLALLAMRPQLQNDSGKSDMEDKKTHRIVFHVTTPDTAAYRAMSRQIVHVLEHWPTAQIEVVAHNKGIGLLEKKKSNVADKISALTTQGVRFVACEQTMKIQKLEKSDILPEAGFVERGVVHVVERQEEGWAYIKAGF